MGRKSSVAASEGRRDSDQPISHAGVNYGHPDKKLYVAARKEVLKVLEGNPKLQKVPKTSRKYHYLHGNVYDLRDFAKIHPGGNNIIEMTAGMVDATPIFESYHAFADRDGIVAKLQKYRVADEDVKGEIPAALYTFKEGDFYDTVTKRVRKYFGATSDKLDESVARNIKANGEWLAIVSAQIFLNVLFYGLAFFARIPMPLAMISAFLAGMFQIQWGFTAMHDASHFGLGVRGTALNHGVMRAWCAWSLWSGKIWAQHHVVRHHAFTGSAELDPDINHALPLVRKHPLTSKARWVTLFQQLGDKFGMVGWGISAVMLYVFTPGMWLGQVEQYVQYGLLDRGMWNLPMYKDLRGFTPQWWEYAIVGLQLLFQIQRLNPLVTFSYMVALNFFYSMCIVADHDLVESAITNHVDVDLSGGKDAAAAQPEGEPAGGDEGHAAPKSHLTTTPDWGEMQVRNTTNFCNDRYHVFAALHGSINYQIEHHLFPGVNHVHLPKISPIVRETCEEFGIPYVTYPRLWDAWYSFLLVMRAVMTEKDTSPQELKQLKHL